MSKNNYDKIFKIFRDSFIDAAITSLNEIKKTDFKRPSTWIDKTKPDSKEKGFDGGR